MKRILLALSINSVFFIPSLTNALPQAASHLKKTLVQPIALHLEMECPHVRQDTDDPNETPLVNNGTTIEGPGHLRINGQEFNPPFYPVFQGPTVGVVPIDLIGSGYFRAGVAYINAGLIQCHYESTKGFDAFDIYYVLQNAQFADVTASTPSGFIGFNVRIG